MNGVALGGSSSPVGDREPADASSEPPPALRLPWSRAVPVTRLVATLLAVAAVVLWPPAVVLAGLAAVVNSSCALRSRCVQTVAVVASAALVLLVVVLAMRPPVDVGAQPRVVAAVGWTVVSGIALAWETACRRRGRTERPWSRLPISWSAVLAGPWVLGAAWAVAVASTPGAARISWAMNRDQANNVMLARFMVEDGGVDPSHQTNPAFLAQALFALPFAGGGDPVPSHLLYASAAVWIGCLLTGASLMALFVLRSSTSRHRPWLAAGVALLTFTWFVAGQSFTFGFLNVSVVVVLLLASCLVAADGRTPGWQVVTVQCLLATSVLATWAPLVLVPVTLAALRVTLERRRGPVRVSRGQGIVVGLALAQVVAYGLWVVLADLGSAGGNLTAGGWIFPVSVATWLLLAGAVGVVGVSRLRAGRRPRDDDWHVESVGLATTGALSAGVVLFMGLNLLAGTPVWSYYPQKLSWIASLVCLVFLAAMTGPLGSRGAHPVRRRGPASRRVVQEIGALGLVVSVLVSVAPSLQGPGVGGVLPVVRMLGGGDFPGAEDAAATAIHLGDRTEPRLVWMYGSPVQDDVVNRWLVNSFATSAADPVRAFGDVFPITPEAVCAAIDALGAGVVVHTNADNVATALQQTCGDSQDFLVVRGHVP